MVQVLKDELRQSILRAAQDEFLRLGYAHSSVKRIAEKVGISVGNLYRYYKGKEDLFDAVVSPAYMGLDAMIRKHDGHDGDQEHLFELIVTTLTNLVGEYRDPLLILIDGSRGTRHEDALRTLYEGMARNVAEHLAAYNTEHGADAFSPESAWPVSVAFMQGLFEIVRRHQAEEDCKRAVAEYVSFWYQGLQAFI